MSVIKYLIVYNVMIIYYFLYIFYNFHMTNIKIVLKIYKSLFEVNCLFMIY